MTVSVNKIWSVSDIHIDYQENRDFLLGLCEQSHQNDVLLIAGDATDRIERLESVLIALKRKFAEVAFVPGNHELWLKPAQSFPDSLAKFDHLIERCELMGIRTQPFRCGNAQRAVWIVPLYSWYEGPEVSDKSLYLEKPNVEDKTLELWSDYFFTRWPDHLEESLSDHFAAKNSNALKIDYDAPVVSFSHFLPRQELMMATDQERSASPLVFKDTYPEFNFSRVAGSKVIDQQIRELGSVIHIYGHQHRNRHRHIEGITYLSHCLGYPKERSARLLPGLEHYPLLIWDANEGFCL